jgi:hypothetical protein
MDRVRCIAIIMLMLVVLASAAGCKSKSGLPGELAGQPGSAAQDQPVTSPDTYLSLFKQWADRLDKLAGEISDAYGKWTSGSTSRQEFLDQLSAIEGKMKELSEEADYKAFELKSKDQQRINSKAIDSAYFTAEKYVNDFLYYAPHLGDDEIKAKYEDLILNKYRAGNRELMVLLDR